LPTGIGCSNKWRTARRTFISSGGKLGADGMEIPLRFARPLGCKGEYQGGLATLEPLVQRPPEASREMRESRFGVMPTWTDLDPQLS
jgi:hypothetical protein